MHQLSVAVEELARCPHDRTRKGRSSAVPHLASPRFLVGLQTGIFTHRIRVAPAGRPRHDNGAGRLPPSLAPAQLDASGLQTCSAPVPPMGTYCGLAKILTVQQSSRCRSTSLKPVSEDSQEEQRAESTPEQRVAPFHNAPSAILLRAGFHAHALARH